MHGGLEVGRIVEQEIKDVVTFVVVGPNDLGINGNIVDLCD
jgi:hypothetical protein